MPKSLSDPQSNTRQLIQQISQLLGPSGVLTSNINQRPTDGWGNTHCHSPAIIRPANTQQLSDVMKQCFAVKQPVVVHGGCTNMTRACESNGDQLVISLERMNQVESIDTCNRTITVGAGTPLQRVQEVVQQHGLFFALDLGARGTATIGGNIATNAGGNQVIRFGMAREQVLGLEVVLADGRILSSMNQMLKNNAGFDLKQLFIGSEGCLGIVTRAVLRLRPLLPVKTTAFVATDTFSHMPRLLSLMEIQLAGKLTSFECLWQSYYRLAIRGDGIPNTPPIPPNHPFYILIEASGNQPQQDKEQLLEALNVAMEQRIITDAVIAESEQQRQNLWAIRDNIPSLQQFAPLMLFDVSLPIGNMEHYLAEVTQRIHNIDTLYVATLGHLGDGNLHIAVELGNHTEKRRRDIEHAIYQPLQEANGSISGEHGIGLEKKPYLSLCRSAEEITVMQSLKQLFDPYNMLNSQVIFSSDQ